MGYEEVKVRRALRRKVETTGIPFFSLEVMIQAIIDEIQENLPDYVRPEPERQTEQVPSMPESIAEELQRTTPPGAFRTVVPGSFSSKAKGMISTENLTENKSCKYFIFLRKENCTKELM